MIEEECYSIRHKSNQPNLVEGTAWQSWQWSAKHWDSRDGHLVSHMVSPRTPTLIYFDTEEHIRWLQSSILTFLFWTDFGDQIFILVNLAFCLWLSWKISQIISHYFIQKFGFFQLSCYNLKVPFLIFCLLLRFLATILAKLPSCWVIFRKNQSHIFYSHNHIFLYILNHY